MQDFRKECFELNNLPYDACISHLAENEHKTAFLKTFDCFLLANGVWFDAAEDISINTKNKLE